MERQQSHRPREEIFRLFDEKRTSGLGFLEFPEKPIPPPLPYLELLVSEVSPNAKHAVEPVTLAGLHYSRLRAGGLKVCEGSLDLIASLNSELLGGQLSFNGKGVLELGCGQGLPGIFACLKGAAAVQFQDFNVEVLQCLIIPNAIGNIQRNPEFSAMEGEEGHINASTCFLLVAGMKCITFYYIYLNLKMKMDLLNQIIQLVASFSWQRLLLHVCMA